MKSVTGFQQEKPELLFPRDFLDLSLPFENQEKEDCPNRPQPLPMAQDGKRAFLLGVWTLQSLKGTSRVDSLMLLAFVHLTSWSCGARCVISGHSGVTIPEHC